MRKHYTFEKLKQRSIIEIFAADDDDWFYRFIKKEKKSGKIHDQYTIIKKDLPLWFTKYRNDGYSVCEKDI